MRTGIIGFCAALLVSCSSALAVEIDLQRPGEREFVRDNAGLLSDQDKKEIQALCDKLLTDKATPIIVITIDRMQDHGGDGMRIETFARLLFDQWQIGPAEINGSVWNTGILLLVSQGDRKARIELGAGWHRDKDQLCKQIMDEQIIPRFKSQDFSGGIKAGVVALDAMGRELQLPPSAAQSQQPRSAWAPWGGLAMIGLVIFTIVSLIRRGSSGWAWLFWGVLFSGIGYILYQMATNSNRGSSSGGYSGGSFGGGYSGGGGASGSW